MLILLYIYMKINKNYNNQIIKNLKNIYIYIFFQSYFLILLSKNIVIIRFKYI